MPAIDIERDLGAFWFELAPVLVLLIAAGALIWAAWSTGNKLVERNERFWADLARDGTDPICVLLKEKFVLPGESHLYVRQMQVVRKRQRPQPDEVIYHNETVESLADIQEDTTAFARWIDAARSEDIPAVYQLGRAPSIPAPGRWQLLSFVWAGNTWSRFALDKPPRILPQDQFELIDADPVEYVISFFRHARSGKPLPTHDRFPG